MLVAGSTAAVSRSRSSEARSSLISRTSSIGSEGVACSNTEWRLTASAPDKDAAFVLLDGLDELAAPDVDTEFEYTLFENALRRRLGQQLHEWKAGVEHREVQRRVKSAEMAGRDPTAT